MGSGQGAALFRSSSPTPRRPSGPRTARLLSRAAQPTGQLKETPQSAYDRVVNTKDTPNSYYGNAWRLFALLLMTGNFPNFYEMAAGPASTPRNIPPPGNANYSQSGDTVTASTPNGHWNGTPGANGASCPASSASDARRCPQALR